MVKELEVHGVNLGLVTDDDKKEMGAIGIWNLEYYNFMWVLSYLWIALVTLMLKLLLLKNNYY